MRALGFASLVVLAGLAGAVWGLALSGRGGWWCVKFEGGYSCSIVLNAGP